MRIERAIRRALAQARTLLGARDMLVSLDDGDYQIIVLPKGRRDPEPESLDHLIASLDKLWKRDFLDWLRKGRAIKAAAELAGVTRRHVHRMYHEDLKFAKAWDTVMNQRDVPCDLGKSD